MQKYTKTESDATILEIDSMIEHMKLRKESVIANTIDPSQSNLLDHDLVEEWNGKTQKKLPKVKGWD